MIVELSRGALVESVHRVDAVVVGPEGPLLSWGDAQRLTIARSSLKFIQALPLLRTGAAQRFALSAEELALACASHSGEERHIEAVRAWLHRIDLGPTALECGPSFPIGRQAAIDYHQAKKPAEPIVHCCSGKHAGFLTVARHLDVDHRGYIEPDHPVQRLVTATVAELTGQKLDDQVPGRDGCGIPTFGVPLAGLATAMARLVTPDRLDPATAAAASQLVDAVVGREFWLSGTDRCEVRLAELASEPLLVKVGAEGVYMAGLPNSGIGVALKAQDGAERAAEASISAILARIGVIPRPAFGSPIFNAAGQHVGTTAVHEAEPIIDRL